MTIAHRIACLSLVLLALAAPARAETNNCIEINAMPFYINSPGIYCLKSSITTALNGIGVNSDDVLIDLNGWVLDGTPGGPTTSADGVFAYNRKHVIVRNGTIRGFRSGVALDGSNTSSGEGYVVERMRLENNVWFGAIVQGKGSIVRNNTVVGTGNGVGPVNSSGNPRGLWIGGNYSHVANNEVLETMEAPGATANGIIVVKSFGAVIEGNVVSNSAFGPTSSYGIYVTGGPNTVAGNRIANMRNGIYIYGTGLYMGNTVGGATTPFSGGTAAGTTNFSF